MRRGVAIRLIVVGMVWLGVASIAGAQAPPTPAVNSVRNAASFNPGISPGVIISIFGTNLTDGRTQSASSVPLPRSLAGATVLIGGIASPLFFVSPTQINAQVPMEVIGQGFVQVQVRVETPGGTSTSTIRSDEVGPVSPGIFTLDQNGGGAGVMQRGTDYSLLCPGGRTDCAFNPAEPGEVLVVYATGLGLVNGNLITGEVATGAFETTNIPTATIGGVPATVLYSGVTVGSVGLYQVNIRVPNQIPFDRDPQLILTFHLLNSTGQRLMIRSNPVTVPAQYRIPQGGGPPGGVVNTIAVNPNDPSIVYAGTEAGVFRSDDGGGRWSQRSEGLTSPYIYKVLIDSSNPATLYAGTPGGVFKSTDGGGSWSPRNTGITVLQLQTLVADPSNPAVLYAVTQLGTFKTVNRAESWTRLPGFPTGNLLAVDPSNSNVLYTNRDGMSKSVDGGATWSRINTGFVSRDQELITAIAIDPSSPSTVYVSANNGTYKSADGGATWSRPSGSREPNYFIDLKIIPGEPQTLIGTKAGIYRSSDGGVSWSVSNGSITGGVERLELDPRNPDTVYLSSVTGVYQSTDRGESWRQINAGLTASNIAALASDRSNPAAVYATDGLDLFRTVDGGTHWVSLNLLRPDLYIYPSHLVVDPRDPSRIFAGGVNGIFGTTDGGVNWTRLNGSFLHPGVVIDPLNSNTLYAFARTSRISKSVDGGMTWVDKTSDVRFVEFSSLAIDPTDSQVVYAGTGSDGIYKSVNGGDTWTVMQTGLPRFGPVFQAVHSIVIDPTNPSRLYAGTSVGVYKSVDGGTNWTASNTAMPELNVSRIVIDPGNSSVLYVVAGDAGIYKSLNGAESWAAHNNGLSYQTVRELLVDPNDSSRVYAGTGRGVFRSTDGGQSWEPTNAN